MITAAALPVEELARAYNLGSWLSIQLLPGGKSQHYHVVTPEGEYVVRRSYRAKTPDGVRFEHELMAYLRRNGFPAPPVRPTGDGDACALVDGRVYSVSEFVRASRYQMKNPRHLEEAARALGMYHRIIESFSPSSPVPHGAYLNHSLDERLNTVLSVQRARENGTPDRDGEGPGPMSHFPYIVRQTQATLSALDRLYPTLPKAIIHGGCRRGSALFSGDSLVAMLDFDSARLEARAMDLAVALHDFAKVYGDPASPDFKVTLDLDVARRFLAVYREVQPLEPSEAEALPSLLMAKRLKRALGRFERLCKGEELSTNDLKKIELELARVRWLRAHEGELRSILS